MKTVLFFVAMILASCAPASRSPSVSGEEALGEIRYQKQLAAKEQMKQVERLYRVGMPILAANAPLCRKKVWPYHGMMLESLASVPDDQKDAMRIYYGVQNQLTAAYIVKGSPADGKIFTGDQILRVNDVPIPSGGKGLNKFYDLIEHDGDQTRPIILTVRRGRNEAREKVILHPTAACASLLVYERKDEVNAFSDGINIIFNTGMMFAAQDDDALAGVIGHELAHNARLHSDAKLTNALIGQIAGIFIEQQTGMDWSDALAEFGIGAFSQEFELEADYVGLYMVARARRHDLERAWNSSGRLRRSIPIRSIGPGRRIRLRLSGFWRRRRP